MCTAVVLAVACEDERFPRLCVASLIVDVAWDFEIDERGQTLNVSLFPRWSGADLSCAVHLEKPEARLTKSSHREQTDADKHKSDLALEIFALNCTYFQFLDHLVYLKFSTFTAKSFHGQTPNDELNRRFDVNLPWYHYRAVKQLRGSSLITPALSPTVLICHFGSCYQGAFVTKLAV